MKNTRGRVREGADSPRPQQGHTKRNHKGVSPHNYEKHAVKGVIGENGKNVFP